MHDHRNDGPEPPLRRANTPPFIRGVRGLGYVDFVTVDLAEVQIPWLLDEIDTLGGTVDEELARVRELQGDPASDAAAETGRLTYKLKVLAMLREQLPSGQPAGRSGVELGHELLTIVGPAEVMTTLIRGAALNTADALGEALRTRASTATGVSSLLMLAHAAPAFARTWVELTLVQTYRFDPDYQPIGMAELE